jgi:hypothetical protein
MALLTCSASTMQMRLLYDVIGCQARKSGRLDQLFANRRGSR